MKNYFILFIAVVTLSACKSTKLPVYVPDQPNAEQAELTVNARLIGLFLHGKVTQLEMFDGCYNDNYEKEHALGHIITEHPAGNNTKLAIPAGKELFFQFGTTEPSWNCHVQFSFIPQKESTYSFNYKMVFGGCEVSVLDENSQPVNDVKLYSSETGYSKSWRKCP